MPSINIQYKQYENEKFILKNNWLDYLKQKCSVAKIIDHVFKTGGWSSSKLVRVEMSYLTQCQTI